MPPPSPLHPLGSLPRADTPQPLTCRFSRCPGCSGCSSGTGQHWDRRSPGHRTRGGRDLRGTPAQAGGPRLRRDPRGLGGHSRSLPRQPNTGTHLTVHTGAVGRGFVWVWVCFFPPQPPPAPICGGSHKFIYFFFPHLLISPSCCPTHHSSSLPTSPGPPSSSQFMFWGYLGALTRVLLLLLRHLHLALQEGHPRRLHLRGLRRPHAGLGAPQRVVGVLGRPVEEEAPLLQLPWGARALSPHAHPAPHFAPSSAPPKVLTPHLKFWIKMG